MYKQHFSAGRVEMQISAGCANLQFSTGRANLQFSTSRAELQISAGRADTSRNPVPKLTKHQHFFVDCGIVLSFLINVSIFC